MSVQSERQTCFVIMPFAEAFTDYYKAVFSPAIGAAGVRALRADDVFRAGSVILDIFDEISRAAVVVADLTGRNPNVLYELGLAHALGRPSVLLAQFDQDIPFDLAHLRQIRYRPTTGGWESEIATTLTKAIQETLADPQSSLAFPGILKTSDPTRQPGELLDQTVALQKATLGKLSVLRADIQQGKARRELLLVPEWLYPYWHLAPGDLRRYLRDLPESKHYAIAQAIERRNREIAEILDSVEANRTKQLSSDKLPIEKPPKPSRSRKGQAKRQAKPKLKLVRDGDSNNE